MPELHHDGKNHFSAFKRNYVLTIYIYFPGQHVHKYNEIFVMNMLYAKAQ